MRRFIASLPGKVVSNLVVLALLLPYLTLTLITRAQAQVQVLPPAAVTEFRNLKSPGTNFGQVAAQDFANALSTANQYDVQSQETVNRTLEQLQITSPPEGLTNLIRLGQAIPVSTIITGDLVDYTVRQVPGGKQALVSLRALVYDVASGLPVNGAALTGQSTVRGGDVKDETLISDAINAAAIDAVRQITQRSLPTGTILNTQTDSALVNQGTRSGFKAGQEVIIVRGREQVASGVVASVEPDSSTVTITHYTRGVAPGDRVRVLFTPPDVRPGFGASGEAHVFSPRPRGISSSVVTALLLVGLLAVLLSGKNSGSQQLATMQAQPQVDNLGRASVLTSWSADAFAGGNANRVQWQIWRNDVPATPVYVVPGTQTSWLDTVDAKPAFSWTYFSGVIGGSTCEHNNTWNDESVAANAVPGVTAGVPYTYQINLVYAINANDLGDYNTSGNNGSTGNTGGTGGNTGGTGGNTGGGTGGNTGGAAPPPGRAADLCYFVSDKATAIGTATPIARPVLSSPANGSSPSSTSLKFYVNSPFTQAGADVNAQYILQFSPTYAFTSSTTFTVTTWNKAGTGLIGTTDNIDTASSSMPSFVKNGDFYWRIGARNAYDNPGPVPDTGTGDRYVFSLPFLFKKSITP